MPELPEVETVRRSLERRLPGRLITGLRVHDFAGVIGDEPVAAVAARLQDRRITHLRRRGKYLLVDLDDGSSIVVHLRMTGRLVLRDRFAAPERFEHLAIELDDGTDIRFADQRKFGRVLHVQPPDVRALSRRLGPEPLGAGFTAEQLKSRLIRRTGKLKSLLLDQTFVAGLGNIYADEALFRARLHPLRTADSLTADDVRHLHRAIRTVLREGLANRGTTFSSFSDAAGAPGDNQHNLRVYGRGRTGEPCPACGSALCCIVVSHRGSHFCPRCQPFNV